MADIDKAPYPKGYYRIPGSKKTLASPSDKLSKGTPNPKKFSVPSKKGQVLIIGVMVMIMTIILFIALLPAIKSVIDDVRGCDSLNCAGYIDVDATNDANCGSTNKTYNASYDEDKLSCTVLDLGIPYLIMGVLVALIAKLLYGKLVEPIPEAPQYGGYGGY